MVVCMVEWSVYHVEVVLCVRPSQQVPNEDIPIMASRQDDPRVKGVWFQDKHLSLMALQIIVRLPRVTNLFHGGPRGYKVFNKMKPVPADTQIRTSCQIECVLI